MIMATKQEWKNRVEGLIDDIAAANERIAELQRLGSMQEVAEMDKDTEIANLRAGIERAVEKIWAIGKLEKHEREPFDRMYPYTNVIDIIRAETGGSDE